MVEGVGGGKGEEDVAGSVEVGNVVAAVRLSPRDGARALGIVVRRVAPLGAFVPDPIPLYRKPVQARISETCGPWHWWMEEMRGRGEVVPDRGRRCRSASHKLEIR